MRDTLLSCPQCKHKSFEDLGETLECPICHSEYDKQDFEHIEGDRHNLLSIHEKTKCSDILKEK